MSAGNAIYDGSNDPPPQRQALRAGPLSLLFVAGELHTIMLGRHEVLRRIYVAVRDSAWRTIPATIANLHVDAGADWFRISFDARHTMGDIDFAWAAAISGDATGALSFAMDGRALSTFRRNRIGICVLHPIDECAGRPCSVEHSDGSIQDDRFPRFIKPHQPFKDIRAITHSVTSAVKAEVRFEGDTFEMEDQRNWTDVSYKTYSTPLALAMPVEVAAGTPVTQRVSLSLHGRPPAHTSQARKNDDVVVVTLDGEAGALPRLGLCVASHGRPLSEKEIARLRALHLSHLRVDLYPNHPQAPAVLRSAAEQAGALGVGLEVALFLHEPPQHELDLLCAMLDELRPPVHTWLVSDDAGRTTTESAVRSVRERLQANGATASIGGGSNLNFTEINRMRPPLAELDLVSYSLNPQCHTFDNDAVVENLEGQGMTIESARHFCGQVPLAISPITLRARHRGDSGAPGAPAGLPPNVDPRQMSLLGAAWTAVSLKQMAQHGMLSATYFETSGWLGVMETVAGSPLPQLFHSTPGSVFPMYHVFADIGDFAGGLAVATTSSHKVAVDGLALRKGKRLRLLIANLTDTEQQAAVRNLPAMVRVRFLDETTFESAVTEPEAFRRRQGTRCATIGGSLAILLRPYAVARIDG